MLESCPSQRNQQSRPDLECSRIRTLIEVLPKHLIPPIYLAYYTGMRQGEILSLAWKKVNMQDGFIGLGPKDTKNSEPRRLYFNDVLWDIFRKAGKGQKNEKSSDEVQTDSFSAKK